KVEANPNRISRLPLPVPGRVTRVMVKLGDSITAGQPVLLIESPEANEAEASYSQSQMLINQAEATLVQAQAGMAKAKADYDRSTDLIGHDAIAQKEVINAESVYKQAKAVVDQAAAAVEQARVARQQALKKLTILGLEPGNSKPLVPVRAPLAGKVLEISVVAGEYRNDTTAPVMTIADLRSVWVTSDVPENSIRLVKAGQQVDIAFDAYPGEEFRGRVARIADTLDPKTRTIKVMVELDNSRGRLKPEMFGRMRHLEAMREVPALPVGAIIQGDGRNVVYVEQGRGRFEMREVVVGNRVGDKVAVVSGVKPGERVVVDGVMLIRS
ncbi:MAG: efflux RND transporter periplasmic adaptor subunit, partial [Blastocatellia bacterium]|nr:efflux RND transporter periplasmic adaptor subunit [Blastocatellia bacterium]